MAFWYTFGPAQQEVIETLTSLIGANGLQYDGWRNRRFSGGNRSHENAYYELLPYNQGTSQFGSGWAQLRIST